MMPIDMKIRDLALDVIEDRCSDPEIFAAVLHRLHCVAKIKAAAWALAKVHDKRVPAWDQHTLFRLRSAWTKMEEMLEEAEDGMDPCREETQ